MVSIACSHDILNQTWKLVFHIFEKSIVLYFITYSLQDYYILVTQDICILFPPIHSRWLHLFMTTASFFHLFIARLHDDCI